MQRWTPLCRLASTLLLLLPAGALAYTISPPENMQDIEDVMGEISEELRAMQCGGDVVEESVGEEPGTGYITKVTGVPGREGLPLADIPSGMGVRIDEGISGIDVDGEPMNDGYEFPDSVTGLSTRCPAGKGELNKVVWSFTRPSWIEEYYAATLYFEDPPCSWRADGPTELHSPETCRAFCDILNEQTYPDCYTLVGDLPTDENPDAQVTCAQWCLKSTCTDGWTTTCSTSLSTLTNGQFGDAPGQDLDALNQQRIDNGGEAIVLNIPVTENINCVECKGAECRCTEEEVKPWEKRPECPLRVPGDLGAPDMSNLSEETRSIIAGCRSLAIGQVKAESPVAPDLEACKNALNAPNQSLMEGRYVSFYRKYAAEFTRKSLTAVVPKDNGTDQKADAACFGFYREIDHAEYRMDDVPAETLGDDVIPWDNRYRRCVVNIDLSKRLETQKGKGAHATSVETSNAVEEEENDTESTDVWIDILRGFSLINPKRTRDIGEALLQLNDGGAEAVIASVGADGKPATPKSSLTRAFDDTGRARSLVTWWQGLVNRAAEIAAPSTLHVLLPPSWVFGLDEQALPEEETVAAMTAQERRMQSVDVQIGATPGALDEVVETIKSGLLFKLEEYPVGITVFSTSAEDLRSLADAHCLYAMRRTGKKTCDAAMTDDQKEMRDMLNKYADAADKTRLLRNELASYITALVQAQTDLLEPVRTWLEENREAYDTFLTRREEMLTLAREWDTVETAMAQFPNMPFCMNQHFLPTMDSLLDPGLEERKALMSAEPPDTPAPWEMPTFPTLPRSLDAVIDLSMLRTHPTTVAVPVLQPIIWRLNMRALAPGKYLKLPEPTDLQPALDALASARKSLPTVCSPESSSPDCTAQAPIAIILPTMPTDAEKEKIRTAMEDIKKKIEEMSVTYGRFWQAAGPLYPKDAKVEKNADGSYTLIDRSTGRTAAGNLSWWLAQGNGGWSDVDENVATLKPQLACEYWNTLPCGFTENDLKEAIARINTRPGLLFPKDLEAVGSVRLHATSCLPGDDVCRVLAAEDRPAARGWQIESPTAQRSIPNIENRIREIQLPEPLGQANASSMQPYDPAGGNVVDIMAPALVMPDEELLLPASSSSSSR